MSTTRKNSSKDEDFDATLKRALAAGDRGRHQDSVKLLLPAAKDHPRSATVAGLLGRAFFELHDPRSAVTWFSKATRLSPRSELSSLGLFHSLWDLGDYQAAFGEMKRYLQGADSDEYRTLLRDLAIEGRLQARPAPPPPPRRRPRPAAIA